ncbi:Tyrosine--tRNA ligase [Geodia barretti]|uniref:Tyrosine--tRNA ligase n=1 Tax=Geodia barretti TaxID=519541 RepID=A0AA35TPF0_GEOBA|nr:Tyrosine--tRNA ligase [Geodia barretti]
MLSPETLDTIVNRGVSEIISRDEFVRMLNSGRPLRLKMGFDPSRPDIHLGHVVGLRKLRQLQELGHQVILIVGDWTAQIGDPSGQSATRPMLTHEQVMENAQSYLRQFFKVVDEDRAQVVQQSEWFGKFTLADVIGLTGRFTVAQFLQRADFAQRFAEQRAIAITELLYPLLQAYDSVVIESDVEFGGTDQMFNLLVGRELQGMMGQTPQQCFMMPILVGTDGVQKMSKSLDNYVAVDERPEEMYGKIMSIGDSQIANYYELLTDLPASSLADLQRDLSQDSVNPMEHKKRLAWDITNQFHDPASADAAQAHFERVVQGRNLPDEMPELSLADLKEQADAPDGAIRADRLLVATGLAPSNAEARRLLTQGAVELLTATGGSSRLDDERAFVSPSAGDVLRAGRRRFVRFTG